MFMVIIGGLGSILGSVLGAVFIVLLPIFLNQALPPLGALVGWKISTATVSHFEIDDLRRPDRLLPGGRAARAGAAVVDRQGEAPALALPALSVNR